MLRLGDYAISSDQGNSFMVGVPGKSAGRTCHPTLEGAVAEVRRRLIHDGFESTSAEISAEDLRTLLQEVEAVVHEANAATAPSAA